MKKTILVENEGHITLEGGAEAVAGEIARMRAAQPGEQANQPEGMGLPQMEFNKDKDAPAGDPTYGAGPDENPFPAVQNGAEPVLNMPSLFPQKRSQQPLGGGLPLPSLFPESQ